MSQIFNQLFSFSKSLANVLGPISVEELVSIEDATPACFARYGMKKISSHAYGFISDGKIDLMEPRLNKNTSNS